MRLNEIASAGGTASGAIATVNGQQGKTQKRNIYGDITLEDLDGAESYSTRGLSRALQPYGQGGHEEALYIDMLRHVLSPSEHHADHHRSPDITPDQFAKILQHWRLNTETSYDFPGLDVAKTLTAALSNTPFASLLSVLDENVEGMIQRR